MPAKERFRHVAVKISTWTGSATTFTLALLVVAVWAVTGPLFDFSNTWQLVINTGTTIVTFLMVFLIQNTQNRDTKAIQLKLDELIKSSHTARNSFVGLEDLTDSELLELDQEFKKMYENLSSTKAMRRLHNKVVGEHALRQSLKVTASQVGQVVSSLLNPFSPNKETKDEHNKNDHDKK
jgi:low affinity Fe/Cu permease